MKSSTPSSSAASRIAVTSSAETKSSAVKRRFPTGCAASPPSNRYWRAPDPPGATRASASRQLRMSPGGSAPYSFRRTPELPASSAAVTIAVIRQSAGRYRRSAMRTPGSPVPPPSATTVTIGSDAASLGHHDDVAGLEEEVFAVPIRRDDLVVVEGNTLPGRSVDPQNDDFSARGEIVERAGPGQHVQHGGAAPELVVAGGTDLDDHGAHEAVDLAHDEGTLGRQHVLSELPLVDDKPLAQGTACRH